MRSTDERTSDKPSKARSTMKSDNTSRGSLHHLPLAAVLAAILAIPVPVEAQYFGRNKVQYDDFDFRVLETDHFDLHHYPEEAKAVDDVARMAERWYERYARAFQHEFEQKKPLIIYADHPDFQQTNILQGFVGEATGGVTESLKNRVIMPLTGSYADTDHVLGHELVHAFQYNIAQSRRGGGLRGLSTLPLWLIEGMAEYLSVGREDPLTGMWLRDAIRNDDFPTIRQMTREQRFFPYRFGQALWAYIGGTYGDDAVTQIFRRSLRIGFQPAIGQVLGLSTDSLSAQWRRAVEQQFVPLMTGRTGPEEVGTGLITKETEGGRQNISPSLSPDGRFIAFLSEKDLFSVDLYLADARTGEVIRKLSSANASPHIDALRYVESSGTWSPDGQYF
ncbi:MAG: peptidase S9, partial [Gemmatimonadota bacterium]